MSISLALGDLDDRGISRLFRGGGKGGVPQAAAMDFRAAGSVETRVSNLSIRFMRRCS